MLLARRLVNGRERGCLQVVSCSVLRLVNMSTRAMRLKTQARALACLQVVYLTLSVVKEQSLSASLVRLEKELFPLYLGHRLRRLRFASGDTGVGPKQSRAWHPRELGQGDACSSLASGKSSTLPARCIHHSRHDASSAGYRLLASFAPGVASREPESRRSPALTPRTRRLDPTFH